MVRIEKNPHVRMPDLIEQRDRLGRCIDQMSAEVAHRFDREQHVALGRKFGEVSQSVCDSLFFRRRRPSPQYDPGMPVQRTSVGNRAEPGR